MQKQILQDQKKIDDFQRQLFYQSSHQHHSSMPTQWSNTKKQDANQGRSNLGVPIAQTSPVVGKYFAAQKENYDVRCRDILQFNGEAIEQSQKDSLQKDSHPVIKKHIHKIDRDIESLVDYFYLQKMSKLFFGSLKAQMRKRREKRRMIKYCESKQKLRVLFGLAQRVILAKLSSSLMTKISSLKARM